MIWWASQPSRARSERLEIAELEERSPWLQRVDWNLRPDGRLCANFEIDRNGVWVPLTLTYPNFFPDMPPQVTPREEIRLSGHQWGRGGELCLEFRPDNWEPSFTGAMVIESAHRLLTGEEPSLGERGEVPSAHRTTLGQEVRTANFRFVMCDEARSALGEAPLFRALDAEVVEHSADKYWLAFPYRVAEGEVEHWNATGRVPPFRSRKGYFVRLNAALGLHVRATYEFIKALVEAMGSEDAKARLESSSEEMILIVESDGVYTLMSLAAGAGERSVYDYTTVSMPAEKSCRLPAGYARLPEASVAIVGCGSVGSKVAATLARAGIGKFVLIDGDIFVAGNLVRNDLDWRAVGLNKPDGVEERIRNIQPSADVTKRRIDLGGQESSGATDAALVAMGRCDVIVDATAEPDVFNLCASVARGKKKALVWGEVFGGGIGGLVARVRPEIEPVPHAARRQILDWCADRGQPIPKVGEGQYGLPLEDDSSPLIADDADVTVMAAQIARLVIDVLANDESFFPVAAYAIGLKPGWIFEAPFDTWPIRLSPEGEWGPEKDEKHSEEFFAFVKEFFPDVAEGKTGAGSEGE